MPTQGHDLFVRLSEFDSPFGLPGAAANAFTGVDRSSSLNIMSKGHPAESKAKTLAKFIVCTLLGRHSGDSNDEVERTLLRCVKMMLQKHEISFKGMMTRLQLTRETGYMSFVSVANTLFEDDRMVITWGRVVALYAFGGRLALYYKENNIEDHAFTVSEFLGEYAAEITTPFVTNMGGWWIRDMDSFLCFHDHEESTQVNRTTSQFRDSRNPPSKSKSKICDEFPEETDLENRVRRVLSWTAVGLGVAATVSYLTSR